MPFNVLNNHDVNFNVAATNQAWAITTSNNYLQIAFGPSLEVRLFRGFSLCGEFLVPPVELHQDLDGHRRRQRHNHH